MNKVILFFIFKLAIACGVIYGLPGDAAKKTLLTFVIELPLWAFLTNLNLAQLRSPANPLGLWRSQLVFCTALGFGLGILFFVVGMIILSFITAITGQDVGRLYLLSFPLFKALALLLSYIFYSREIDRLKSWGLNYKEQVGHEGPTPDEDTTTQGMGETLRMLTILDLEPDLTIEQLKSRYKDLVKLYHPDRLSQMSDKERATAEKEFKRMKRAYEIVKNQIEKGNL